IDRLEGEAHGRDQRRTALDTDALRRDSHPGVALPDQLRVSETPTGPRIDTAADVEPLDDDRAVELLPARRPVDDDPRLVGGRVGRRGAPLAVGAEWTAARVGVRRAGHEKLFLHVADGGEIEARRLDVRAPWARDRSLECGARDLGGGDPREQREQEEGDRAR